MQLAYTHPTYPINYLLRVSNVKLIEERRISYGTKKRRLHIKRKIKDATDPI